MVSNWTHWVYATLRPESYIHNQDRGCVRYMSFSRGLLKNEPQFFDRKTTLLAMHAATDLVASAVHLFKFSTHSQFDGIIRSKRIFTKLIDKVAKSFVFFCVHNCFGLMLLKPMLSLPECRL